MKQALYYFDLLCVCQLDYQGKSIVYKLTCICARLNARYLRTLVNGLEMLVRKYTILFQLSLVANHDQRLLFNILYLLDPAHCAFQCLCLRHIEHDNECIMILKIIVRQAVKAFLACCVTEFYNEWLSVNFDFHLQGVIVTNRCHCCVFILHFSLHESSE